MKRHLLDTNHLGEAIGPVSIVRDRIQQFHRQGYVFGTCVPVLCELMEGVVMRKDVEKMRRRLDGLLQVVRIWPVESEIADHYAETYHELKPGGWAWPPGTLNAPWAESNHDSSAGKGHTPP